MLDDGKGNLNVKIEEMSTIKYKILVDTGNQK